MSLYLRIMTWRHCEVRDWYTFLTLVWNEGEWMVSFTSRPFCNPRKDVRLSWPRVTLDMVAQRKIFALQTELNTTNFRFSFRWQTFQIKLIISVSYFKLKYQHSFICYVIVRLALSSTVPHHCPPYTTTVYTSWDCVHIKIYPTSSNHKFIVS